ncbi:MAG: isocitrate dehydrogenase (NADP(+)) [Candidatus Coatesbacteria bacterium]
MSLPVPSDGQPITIRDGRLVVPDRPVIPFIEGDGTGRDIWRASSRVLSAAVEKAYAGRRSIAWLEVLAGEKAFKATGTWLPDETLEAIRRWHVAIKGPLTTPIGGGIRSLNVTLRQALDLYACVRPVRWFNGVPSPMKEPQRLDIVIFRENTEDVYAGIEWPAGSPEAKKFIEFVKRELGATIRPDSGVGVKPISPFGTKRLMRMALKYAAAHGRTRVTIMHKGNIMKYTEGAFRQWAYDVAKDEFGASTVTEEAVGSGGTPAGASADGKILVNDRIADITFQHLLLRPDEFEVIVTPNLNGDYLSDAAAAQVGGLGLAPGANIGDEAAVFEATHGTAPKYADRDMVNPCAVILSGAMMLEHLGWGEAAARLTAALDRTIGERIATYDLARQMAGARQVGTAAFGDALIERL